MMETYAYSARVERNETGGFTVLISTLGGLTARADTYAAALVAAREAIEHHLESLQFHGVPIPAEDHAEAVQVVIAAEPLFPPKDLSPGTTWSVSRSRGVSFGTGYTRGIEASEDNDLEV
jgi:predicted RNase H-like HicB family nuclease